MEKVRYAIIGNLSDVSDVIDLVRTEDRFLSDKPNVLGFEWTATSEDEAEGMITVESKIDADEVAILTAEYASLLVMELSGDEVSTLFSGGVQEQLV